MSDTSALYRAPWSTEDVVLLSLRQQVSWIHEYTCNNGCEIRHGTLGMRVRVVLAPTLDGWRCPLCDYHQDWVRQSDIDLARALREEAQVYALQPAPAD
jgi:hypothetical protein